MEPEDLKQELAEIRELAENNHTLLTKLHRAAVIGRVIRFIYWGVIIAAGIGLFYYLEPYLENFSQIYNSNSQLQSGGIELLLNGLGDRNSQ